MWWRWMWACINTDLDLPGLRRQKAARGTMNITQGPAMTREQMARTLEVGISLAGEMKSKGYDIVCIGEMGIGNTTTSSAVASVLLGVAPERVTGRGAGLSDAGLRRKLDAIHRAIQVNQPDAHDPRDVLRKLGGFDMAAMAGICLGGAKHRVPIVIDGMISAVSALLAARMNPDVLAFLLPSHMSREPSTALIMDALGLDPIIRADMALGGARARSRCCRCWIWRWRCTTKTAPLRRLRSRSMCPRTAPDDHPLNRRQQVRQKQAGGTAYNKACPRQARSLPGHHAGR